MNETHQLISRFLSHRLRGFHEFEGSLLALEIALSYEPAWIEIDTRITANGDILIFHDARLDNLTDSSGYVSGFNHESSRLLFSGSQEHQVPTLAEFLEVFASLNEKTKLMIDIKDPGAEAGHVNLIRQFDLVKQSWVISWCPHILRRIHEIEPSIALGFSTVPLTRYKPLSTIVGKILGRGLFLNLAGHMLAGLRRKTSLRDVVLFFDEYNKESTRNRTLSGSYPIHLLTTLPKGEIGKLLQQTGGGIGAPASMLTREFVADAHAAGLKVFTYTINSHRQAKRAIDETDVDIVFTDNAQLFERKHSDVN